MLNSELLLDASDKWSWTETSYLSAQGVARFRITEKNHKFWDQNQYKIQTGERFIPKS